VTTIALLIFPILALLSHDPPKSETVLPLPELISAELPRYPAVARQARVEGEVRLRFVLSEAGKATAISVQSGHPMLIGAAKKNVETWVLQKPQNLYRSDWEYSTTFVFRMSGKEVECAIEAPLQRVEFSSFERVVLTSDACKPDVTSSR
jgi:TonB family protein